MKNGDKITINSVKRTLTRDIPVQKLVKREKAWKNHAPRYSLGVLAKYGAHVTSASRIVELEIPNSQNRAPSPTTDRKGQIACVLYARTSIR